MNQQRLVFIENLLLFSGEINDFNVQEAQAEYQE